MRKLKVTVRLVSEIRIFLLGTGTFMPRVNLLVVSSSLVSLFYGQRFLMDVENTWQKALAPTSFEDLHNVKENIVCEQSRNLIALKGHIWRRGHFPESCQVLYPYFAHKEQRHKEFSPAVLPLTSPSTRQDSLSSCS